MTSNEMIDHLEEKIKDNKKEISKLKKWEAWEDANELVLFTNGLEYCLKLLRKNETNNNNQ